MKFIIIQLLFVSFALIGGATAYAASGSIIAPPCTVPTGQSSCATTFNWSSSNASNVTISSSAFATQSGTSGGVWGSINPSGNYVSLRDNGVEFTSITVTAACQSGSTWNGSVCQGAASVPSTTPPVVTSGTISVSDCVIGVGQSGCTASVSLPNELRGRYIENITARAMTSVWTGGNFNVGSFNSSSIDLTYGANLIVVSDNGGQGAQVDYQNKTSATASCASGSTWSNGKCIGGSLTTSTVNQGSFGYTFSGCVVPVGAGYCYLPILDNSTSLQQMQALGQYNTTGVPLIVSNQADNLIKDEYGNRINATLHPTRLIIPTNTGDRGGSRGVDGNGADAYIFLIPGANTITITKNDGTVVGTQTVYASCESGSTWTLTTEPYLSSIGQVGKCLSSVAGSVNAPVDSFTASDCVITLGNSLCSSDITITAAPKRDFELKFTNEEAVGLFSTGGSKYIVKANGLGIFGNGQESKTPSGTYKAVNYTTKYTYRTISGAVGNMITYGVNTLVLTESRGKEVGKTTAKATCAPGLVWTWFSTGEQITSTSAPGEFKCVPPLPGKSSSAATQKQEANGRTMKVKGDPQYGLVEGYCPIGQKWSIKFPASGNAEALYDCLPNTDTVDVTSVKASLSTALHSSMSQYAGSASDCGQPRNSSNDTCMGTLSITAPAGRTFTLYRTDSLPLSTAANGVMGDVTENEYTDRRYTLYETNINSTPGTFYPISIPLSYATTNTFELRLGSTVVARISAKAIKSSSSVRCSAFNESICYPYTWEIGSVVGTGANTNTTTTPPTTYPVGCTSLSGFSATTGKKCDGTTTTGTNTNTNINTTVTTPVSSGPLSLSTSQVSGELKGILLKWKAPSNPVLRYKVSYVTYNAQGIPGPKEFQSYIIASATDYVLSPLDSGVKYDIYLAAVDANGNDFSESVLRNVTVATGSTNTTTTNTSGTNTNTGTGTTNTNGQPGDIDPNGSTGGMCLNLTTDLRQGTRNTSVESLQDFLITANYLNAEATGYFGALTFRAVQNYQKDKGFTQSGFVGPLTRAAIQKDSCGS